MKEDRILSHLQNLAMQTKGIDGGRVRMAAAITYKKQILSTGVNKMKTHPIMNNWNGYREGQYFLHAEIDAIVNSKMAEFDGCDLYIVRILKSDDFALAKPCEGCTKVISAYNFKNVYYTNDDGTLSVL